MTGRVGIEATLSGTWNTLQVDGKLRLESGEVSGWSLAGFSTRFTGRRLGDDWSLRTQDGQGVLLGEALRNLEFSLFQQGGQLLLQALSTRIGSGSLAASGALGPDSVDLKVLAASLPMNMLPKIYPELQASGALDFTGQLAGTSGNFRLAGRFLAMDGMVFHQPFTRAMGNISYHSGTVVLDDVEIRNGKGLHEISGSVALAGSRALDLKVKTQGARAEDIVAWLAPGELLTGNVENEVQLGGTLDAIEADGKVTLWEGSYRGYLLSKVSGDYRRSGGVLSVKELEVD